MKSNLLRSAGFSQRRRAFALFALLCVLARNDLTVFADVRGDDRLPELIAVPKTANGKLLAPGRSAKLKVKVTDRDGRPLAGRAVLFVAPETGATGTFQGATPAGATFIRRTTNAAGVASAKLVAGPAAGVFLVDAVVEPTDDEATGIAATSFAITTVAGPPPALPPARARLAVREQLLSDAVDDETLRLHGPVLLPAGARVTGSAIDSQLYPAVSVMIERPTWFFWVDEVPAAAFEHPTRFVLLDATDATPDLANEATVVQTGWWPNVTLPGEAEATALLPPYETNASLAPPAEDDTALDALAPQPPADACAIVVHGPSERAQSNSAAVIRQFLRDTNRVPGENIFHAGSVQDPPVADRPVTRSDLARLFAKVRMMGCKKVWFSFTGHGHGISRNGTPGGFTIGNESNTDGSTQEDYFGWDELGRLLEPFRGTNTEFCVVLAACHAGGAIGYLQDRGVGGTAITACAAGKLCRFFPGPTGRSFFVDAVRKYLSDPANDANGDGMVTLDEIFSKLRANRGLLQDGHPADVMHQISAITPTSRTWPADNLVIKLEDGAPIDVRLFRPIGATGNVQVRVQVADPTIAAFRDEVGDVGTRNVLLSNDVTVRTVPLFGRKHGVTTYTIVVRDLENNTEYTGMGTIQVGCGYYVEGGPVCVVEGASALATLVRTAPAIWSLAPAVVRIESSNPAVVAVASPAVLAPGAASAALPLTGVAPGSATIAVRDQFGKVVTTFEVMVKPASCEPGMFTLTFEVKEDPAGHDPFVRLRSGKITVVVDGTAVQVVPDPVEDGDGQIVIGFGTFTGPCKFDATGRGTVSGIADVECMYKDMMISGDGLTGCYVLGTNGRLPTGRPISYRVTGTRVR
jgi:hypothetical protein